MHNYSDMQGHEQPTIDPSIPLKRASLHYGDEEASKAPKRTRGRTGCLNCRRRRKKCDESKPDCTKCRSRGETCEWDTGITFRLSGLDPDHPSMLQSKAPKHGAQANLKIVDVKFHKTTPGQPAAEGRSTTKLNGVTAQQKARRPDKAKEPLPEPVFEDDPHMFIDEHLFEDNDPASCLDTIFEEPSAPCVPKATSCQDTGRPTCRPFPYEQANPLDCMIIENGASDASEPLFDPDEQMTDYARSNSEGSCSTGVPSGPWSAEPSGSSVTSVSSRSAKPEGTRHDVLPMEDGLTHLDSLDYLMAKKSKSYLALDKEVDSNIVPHEDSPPLESSRSRLFDNIQDLARKLELSSHPAGPGGNLNAGALQDLKLSGGYRSKGIRLLHSPLSARPLGCTKLLKRRQLELWRNYTQEVAPWMDVSGSKRYYQHTIPLLAKSADYLHYAVLAVSSRHLELRETGSPGVESTGLCADAIQLLLPELHTLDTPVIAACILLCVAELMSSLPSLCRKSLTACAKLLEMADINARSNGIQQALFWSFANLALWSGLVVDQAPIMLVRQFYPSESLSTAVSYIRSQTWGEGYAKYAAFLISMIVSVVSNESIGMESQQGTADMTRWKVLFDLLEDWHNCRPEEMQALMSYPSILDDYRHPFPMVLYGSASAVVGNLLYHAASIMLLQRKPYTIALTKSHKSLLWHARQICGIVAENHEKGAWACAVQPLWVAGKVISNEMEREKILEMMNTVQQESGWSVSWYVEDLKFSWGAL